MNFAPVPRRSSASPSRIPNLSALLCRLLSLFLGIVTTLTGCKREEIRVYTVHKEKPAETVNPDAGMTVRPRSIQRPQLEWKLPAGWTESGSDGMNLASFAITGNTGQQAQVTITPLPPMAGREALFVNMWREQMGLDALPKAEAQKQFQPVQVGDEKGNLFESEGKPADSREMRILIAMVHHPDSSLFYKLAGDAALVAAQKPAFFDFLKSIHIKQSSPATDAPAPLPAPTAKFNWQIPTQWKQIPAGEMQVARFSIPERDGSKAEVFVSVFGSDTGGTLANVNRWRRELGLANVDNSALPNLLIPLDPSKPDVICVDLTNQNRRLVAAIVPRDGNYWFYKIRGDTTAVTPERDAFLAFVKSKP